MEISPVAWENGFRTQNGNLPRILDGWLASWLVGWFYNLLGYFILKSDSSQL